MRADRDRLYDVDLHSASEKDEVAGGESRVACIEFEKYIVFDFVARSEAKTVRVSHEEARADPPSADHW